MVTVLMAVRNTPPAMLGQAIDSIRGQTFRNFEFLILDDGSDDEATRVELARQAAADSRIRLEWCEHRGLTATLNHGLALASGEWIARQDADDWSDPQRFERQLQYLRTHPEVALCGTGALLHQRDGTPLWTARMPEIPAEVSRAFWHRTPFVHGSTMFRASAARQLGGYREEFRRAQDYDFFWRFTELFGGANLPEPLYHYRYSGGAVSVRGAGDQAVAHRAARLLAQARRAGIPERPLEALMEAQRQLAVEGSSLRAALKQADHLLLAGDYREARASFWKFLRENPLSALVWGKLLRCVLFTALPPARPLCFRAAA